MSNDNDSLKWGDSWGPRYLESLENKEHVLSGGHGLMVQGYYPLIKALAKDIDIRLNHRVTRITRRCNKVVLTVEGGRDFVADVAIITVPLGVLKANIIEFEPKLPDWKLTAISDLGFGSENKIALHFNTVFWPNVELLGVVAPTSYACGYFLNLHKASGHPVLVYMAAGTSPVTSRVELGLRNIWLDPTQDLICSDV